MTELAHLILFTGALAMIGCCLPPHAYQGDGSFSHSCSRYVLDLGELDLSSPADGGSWDYFENVCRRARPGG